uniref:Zona pellucida sperm-binding protein 3 n=1 Tax=Paramormyrops kingsleyae TaxID=1676925 RepID=A0A3B3RZP3_9TELE
MVLISLFYCSILVDSFPAVLTYDGFPTIRKQLLNPTGQLTLPETALIHPPQINPGIAVGELYPSPPPLVGPAAVISDMYTIVAPQKPNGPDMGAGKLYSISLPQQVLQKGVGFADSVPRQNPVTVKCHAATIEVIVNADLYSTGTLINGSDLRLGLDAISPSSCFAIASGESEFTIHAELKECGTKLWFTPDALIYTNNLIYSPVPFDGVIRLEGVVVPIECHYGRRYNISNDLQPTWVPFIGTSSAEEILDFSLMLMSSDWLAQRSSIYFPGEIMYFEASVRAGLMSLRVFVDYCIATLVPDWTTHPQYSFIENYGCLTDAKRTGSCSLFQPRSEDHKLRFQLEAFRFSQQASPSLYITCHLKAVPVTNMDLTNKACSFIEDSWKSADGNDGVYMGAQAGEVASWGSNHRPGRAQAPRSRDRPQMHSKINTNVYFQHQLATGFCNNIPALTPLSLPPPHNHIIHFTISMINT